MKKILKIAGWTLLALFVLYTFYFLWKQAQPVPVRYETETPEIRDIVRQTVATGALEPRTQVELKPQVTGIISELRVNAGDHVKKGDLIAVIRVIPNMSQLNQAQSEVAAAKIELSEVEREAERSQRLFDKGVIGREENEQQQSRLESSKERLAAAQSQVEVITSGSSSRVSSVNTTEVRSSMDGLVLSVPVKNGVSVSGSSEFSSGTTIATVADMTDIIFRGNIDETDVASLYNGMPVELVPGAMQDVSIPAELEYISPEGVMTNGTKMFELKATANIPEGVEIRSGYSANANIALERVNDALSVNETCVEFEGDNAYVYRLVSDESDDKEQQWERVPVTVGVSDGIYIEIKSGVSKTDKLRGLQL